MNQSETKAKRWLLEQGYKEIDIVFQGRGTPDFLCSDGKKYEVKRLYGHGIWFHQGQMERIVGDNSTEILVMKDDEEEPILIIDAEQVKEDAVINGIKIGIAGSGDKKGKTVMFDPDTIDIIENYRIATHMRRKEIPSFSNAVNELIMLLNPDNDTHIRIEQYAKDCNIEMSEAYSDIIRIGLEIIGNKNNKKI